MSTDRSSANRDKRTDGITEAQNLNKEFYGLEKLTEVARNHRQHSAEQICKVIIDDLRSHISTQKVCDDITLVVLKQL
ncbi:PP2C family protein-serine/threonine phosphatase [Roseofilum casamattae]|uniref:SpoIIE family protein phosphatase n=1 Tax=Roseofilum casamattae BLCC-M143 TaxID=3022442 RepID=A0ABT7C0R2_9CYAN|nr:SpoIIE family protein phosphatase [Roseofilum casamattae]MDJ1185040.1 SpoIIE family protein phosphatase [Roseofilum casamattae BLCC-M143]